MSVVFPDFLSCHRGYPSSNNHNSISTDIFMQIEPLEKAHFLLYYDITISKCPSGAKSLHGGGSQTYHYKRFTTIPKQHLTLLKSMSLQEVHHHSKVIETVTQSTIHRQGFTISKNYTVTQPTL